jgi:hypothetical protein
MAQERKASDSASPASRGLRSPVPTAKKDDIEDVAWALQTAEATWSRGDHADALKWIRRAAEAASEAEKDDRALELAKAAADVASLLADRPTTVIPAPALHVPPPPPFISTAASPPPPPSPAAARPATAAPTPSKVATTAAPPLPRPGQRGPIPQRVQGPVPASRRGGRRSSPSFIDDASVIADAPRARRGSTTNETKKRGRLSKPAHEEVGPPETARHPPAEGGEQWPTAALIGDDEDDGQHTRIGTPAYRESAREASARPPPMGPPAPLQMSQAVRVVVWRAADGVHVAPAGTQVAAIGVEAVLVAMDPLADLAAWLSNK